MSTNQNNDYGCEEIQQKGSPADSIKTADKTASSD